MELGLPRGEAEGRGACPSRRVRLVYKANLFFGGMGEPRSGSGGVEKGGVPPSACSATRHVFALLVF